MEGQLFFPWAMTIPGIKHVFDNMTGDMLNKLNRVSKPFKSSFTDRDRLKQRLLRPTWKGRFQLRLSNMAAPANGGFLKRGDPKIIHFIGFSIINYPGLSSYWGTTIYGNPQMILSPSGVDLAVKVGNTIEAAAAWLGNRWGWGLMPLKFCRRIWVN